MSVVPFFLIQNPERNIGEENIRHLKYILLFQISLDICINFVFIWLPCKYLILLFRFESFGLI